LIYVGRLVPYKACDLALRGSAQLLRQDLARLTIVGDGPERKGLEQLAKSLGIEKVVSFCGWLNHSEAMQRLQSADVLVFPSIREFGGGVVFEALALGVVPVVADFGGPGDIVHSGVGYRVALANESDMVCQIEKILSELAGNRSLLDRLSQEGMKYAREALSWDGKAQVVTMILSWAIGKGPKPDLPPPKELPQQCW
jgi:glycosyltransferase involved in cell wall biosynthesis